MACIAFASCGGSRGATPVSVSGGAGEIRNSPVVLLLLPHKSRPTGRVHIIVKKLKYVVKF